MSTTESFSDIKRSLFANEPVVIGETQPTSPSILIIDDNQEIMDALASILSPYYRTILCSSFNEASRTLDCCEISLVLLDIKMADQDGIEVFKRLKRKCPDLRIVFHSAYPGGSEKVTQAAALKHSGFLTKGEYDLAELLATISQSRNE